MKTCFIIQPFDKGKFDKRFKDSFEPAIIAAGLNPYRVDRDPSVRIPIEQIEEGIKSAKICFAEITLDNPNVWYELGFAFACGKDVVMVSEEREDFPFDIRHRQVINYKTSSKSDYLKLEIEIKEKFIALLGKQESVKHILESPIKESEGLKSHEVTMLFLVMENQTVRDDNVSIFSLKSYMDKAGFNSIATSLALRVLEKKGLVETYTEHEFYNNQESLLSD